MMEQDNQPKIWENLRNSSSYIPVIVKTVEHFYDTSWSMEPNSHEFFEMVYIKKGHAVFEISDKPANIGPNDIVIIKPNQSHRLLIKSKEGCEFIVLSFRFVSQSSNEFSEVPLEDFLNFVSSKESGSFISLKVSQKNEIITILNRLIKERGNNDIGSDFLDHLLVMELFVYISRALKMEWETSIKGKTPKIEELIKISVKYINNNFERDINIENIAKYVFLSQSYFTRIFKEVMGTSPINYLIKVRIERSKELMEDKSLKISDIAYSVGFSNQQRFNEMFKKYTGYTPLKYRKEFGQKTLKTD